MIRRLAIGGMAELFLASRDLPGGGERQVVLKRLLPGADEECGRLFEREREVLSRIESPHVVTLLDCGPGFLVLEFVDGPDLASIITHLARRGRAMPLPAAMAVLDGLCSGLAAIHRVRASDGRPLNAVHRDVNPSNVLVSREGDVKIADLGVVHADLGGMPTTSGLKGTLAYMAPEQLMGRPVDARTDIYCAGLVAYEVLTGMPARPPGMAGVAELLAARTTLPAPPSLVRPDLGEAFDRPILAALSPAPEDRPDDAGAWFEDIARAEGTRPDRSILGVIAREVEKGVAGRSGTMALPAAGERRRARSPLLFIPVVGLAIAALAVLILDRDEPVPDLSHVAQIEDITTAIDLVPSDSPPPTDASRARPDSVSADSARGADLEMPVRPAPPAKPEPSPPSLRVRSSGGSLHVSGGGKRGLAPVILAPDASAPELIRLTGGPDGLVAFLRVSRSGEGFVFGIGAPEGTYYKVRCGGRQAGFTPIAGIRLEREVECTLEREDGAAMTFVLECVKA